MSARCSLKRVYPGVTGDQASKGPSSDAATAATTSKRKMARPAHLLQLRIHRFQRGVRALDIGVEKFDELRHDAIAAQSAFQFAVDVHWRYRLLKRAGK